ncbi:hypothetical protein FRC01_010146 [Tulasnella sp. 417]|nr:hypothetical protein FRC01_010146 [Tulasnella sp. 417]
MKRNRDEQDPSVLEKGQDPTQPPLKIARRTNTGLEHPNALYTSLYSSLLEDLSSDASDSSESSDSLSSISSLSSDSSSVQRIAKRLDKVRKKILASDRRMQRTVMLLSTYSAAEDNLEMTTLLLLLMRRCYREQYDFDLEMLVDELEDAAEDHKELRDNASQAEQALKEFGANPAPGPIDVLAVHRVHQNAQVAMEEAERWAGLLKATQEQSTIANQTLRERATGLEKENDRYKEELTMSQTKNQELLEEVAKLRAQLLGSEGPPKAQTDAVSNVNDRRKTLRSSAR